MEVGSVAWHTVVILLAIANLGYGSYKISKREATMMSYIYIGIGTGALARVVWQVFAG